ncbi:MAG: helix-turn-helix transcriptional regulator [Chlorobia bacterium]|nr:helix-turn-helix transcriptional regulator [Fimbriimonadaceae bacterium]
MKTTHKLSARENEIVELSMGGLTNEAIANRLGVSIGTVNTYWIRIKVKVGGIGRTETIANILKERAELSLDKERIDWDGLERILAKREVHDVLAEKEHQVELRTTLALLDLAMDKSQTTVWATNQDLSIHSIVNGKLPSTRFGVQWEEGKSIYEIFKTADKAHPAVAAHVDALAGSSSQQRLGGAFANTVLRVLPVADEFGEVMCCVSILTYVGEGELIPTKD